MTKVITNSFLLDGGSVIPIEVFHPENLIDGDEITIGDKSKIIFTHRVYKNYDIHGIVIELNTNFFIKQTKLVTRKNNG